MPLVPSLQNNFIAGFKTEFTGLNFPENAATDTANCVFKLTGDITRRLGFNQEANGIGTGAGYFGAIQAFNNYKWKNVGGDGQTEVLVIQTGRFIHFYKSSASTVASPLSSTKLATVIDMQSFQAQGNGNNIVQTECQFSDGNGFLFVYHKDCDTIYCTFDSNSGTITAFPISLQIRDVVGIPEPGVQDNFRPTALTNEHNYNLLNQGWTFGSPWSGQLDANGFLASSGGTFVGVSWTFLINSETNTTSLGVGKLLRIVGTSIPGPYTATTTVLATVTSYTPGVSITVTVVSTDWPFTTGTIGWGVYSGGVAFFNAHEVLSASLVNAGFVTAWHTSQANYPSNSDVWWYFKDTTNAFNPGLMAANVQQNAGAAPKGALILNAFNQTRTAVSGVSSLTDVKTVQRASNGCWFQGRVFFTGVNSSQLPSGDEPYYTWTENIYFSQVVQTPSQFGKCYQVNDPTSQDFFDILPTDGGVITIQGTGAIYKLFPLENGIIVFAANGIWYLTGSQGIGFSASDYTVRKVSNIQSIGYSSYVNVNGYPMFWNEEGIYYVTPSQYGSGLNSNATTLQAESLVVQSILTYYKSIPKVSKLYARGDYDNINYIVQWVFRSTAESSISDRYFNDTILNFNTVTKAFYLYKIPTTSIVGITPRIVGLNFITYPGGSTAPSPTFKYITIGLFIDNMIFAEEYDTGYVDWKFVDGIGENYDSHFISGYKLTGKALNKFHNTYLYLFLRNSTNNSYKLQSLWDFSISGNSGKWSPIQLIQDTTNTSNYGMIYRKHKLRGRGMTIQIKIQSYDGQPFDIMGWSVLDNVMSAV